MKKTTLLFFAILLLPFFKLSAQDKNNISFHVNTGGSIYDYHDSMEGGDDYNGKGFVGLGATYYRHIVAGLQIGTGLEFSHYKVKSESDYSPDKEQIKQNNHLNYISIPIDLKYKFGNHFFINGGGDFNFKVSNINTDNFEYETSVFGLHVGLGLEYKLANKITISANPYFKTNDLRGNRLIDFYVFGIKAGVGLHL